MKKELSAHAVDFIDDKYFDNLLNNKSAEPSQVRDIIAKSLDKKALNLDETAALLRTDDPELVEEIFAAARRLKKEVYGNRIVLFAPLYIGNECVNDCAYCAFRRSNKTVIRRTLNDGEIESQVKALEDKGHKRLILVFGEHPQYNANYISDTVRKVYSVKHEHGEIRRVNINAAPMDHEGFKMVKEAGIGTYQIFMETYHHETYKKVHPQNTLKADYLWRLDGLSRAFETGCDDMGIGALFGLYDWRFDVLGLVRHSLFLQERYGVGPHTISFPRLKPANGVVHESDYLVNDYDFKRLVAILRLSVPYTGMILTARESEEIRREVMSFGVSQIDAGSRIEIGGYTEAGDAQTQVLEREQFSLGDLRSLDTVMRQLMEDGYMPSFCTSCYRLGRTGEHFMEFAIPGFIEQFCTPNAILTLMEYLTDYASPETRISGEKLIGKEINSVKNSIIKSKVLEQIDKIKTSDARDFYF
ncbi:MAG: [FeFe] hydrogenase H-cluster radical SAM maturase HydG [Calditrichaceae bacterium]|nr:[FeFe] hydrogenase H-cluster radical SAM maturase HydG [Calditrichaceae bacterium]